MNNAPEQLVFVSSRPLFNRVKEYMKSFDAAGMIDEGQFYDWVKDIIDYLGIGVYMEQSAVIRVENRKAPFPPNFSILYRAFKVEPQLERSTRGYLPGTSITVDTQVTNSCDALPEDPCADLPPSCVIETTHTVTGKEPVYLANPTPLKLSGRIQSYWVDDKCVNLYTQSENQFWMDPQTKMIGANFSGWMIMQYYGFPIEEETGLPAIPDVTFIEQAIEYYIYKRLLETWWVNSSVPDLERKLAYFKGEADEKLKDAIGWVKTPSFRSMIAMARRRRKSLDIYQFTPKRFWF